MAINFMPLLVHAASGTPTPFFTPTSTAGGGGIPMPEKPENLPSPEPGAIITFVIKAIFGVGEIAFLIMLLVGGVTFITASGDEAKVEKAKKLLFWAVLGAIVLLSAWGIATYILNQFKV